MLKCECTGFYKHVLTEAEEECIDTHVVHTEESMSDEVAAKHHRLQRKEELQLVRCVLTTFIQKQRKTFVTYNNWHPVVVEGFRAEGVAWQQDSSREEEEGQHAWKKRFQCLLFLNAFL